MNNNLFLKKMQFLILMASFGCLGPILRNITLPVSVTVCLRAWLAAIAIIGFIIISRQPISRDNIRACYKPILACGILLAADWIGLFTAYQYTTIATATICYYIVPILVLLASPFVLGEHFTLRHAVCTFIAFCGMALVSGAVENGLPSLSEIKGILFALFGAIAYAGIILINKKYPVGTAYLRTSGQLLIAAIISTPYILLTNDINTLSFTLNNILLLTVLGVGLTAITYIAYFHLILNIPIPTIAVFSYADPVTAVLISICFLGEPITLTGLIGSIMIITAAIAAEFSP